MNRLLMIHRMLRRRMLTMCLTAALFAMMAASSVADEIGDINLNGIPYEAADLYQFKKAMYDGQAAAFAIDAVRQAQATDVNGDGLLVTVEDYVYFMRIVANIAPPGLAGPFPTASVTFTQDVLSREIRYFGTDSLCAVLLTFIGPAEVYPTQSTLRFDWNMRKAGDTTFLFIAPGPGSLTDSLPFIPPGNFARYWGRGELVAIEAADYQNTVITEAISVEGTAPKAYLNLWGTGGRWPSHAQVYVDLTGPAPDFEMGGFDLLFQYDANLLTLATIEPGDLIDSCGWEYFTWRAGSTSDCDGTPCPTGVIRIVSLAETNNGDVHPSCYGGAGTLAHVDFDLTDSGVYAGSPFPVEWLWYDCGDNAISSKGGDTLFVSSAVFDPEWEEITADGTFPTLTGTPSSCTLVPEINRDIVFSGGKIHLLSDRGDINLDGMAYTIADAVLFSNYFYYGESIFTVNLAGQIWATETNDDEIPLTLDDLVYLARVVVGDAPPLPRPALAPSDTAVIVQDDATGTVTITYPNSLRAVYLKFAGTILYESPWDTLAEPWPHLDGNTPLLAPAVYDLLQGASLPPTASGLQLCTYTGTGLLIEAQASYDGLTEVPVKIIHQNMPACCQLRGDFNYSGAIDISDITALVSYLFRSGVPSACAEHMDFDASGEPNVSDLTKLVAYVFRGGPPPAACP